jgi:hypothetical protein
MRGVQIFLLAGFLCCCSFTGFGQIDSTIQPETTRIQARPIVPKPEEAQPVKKTLPSVAIHNTDSVHKSDSLRADSVKRATLKPVALVIYDTSTYKKYETHPFLPLRRAAIYMLINYHEQSSRDDLFYLMAGIVFVLAFIRMAFFKYFRNLFLLFFQTSLRQKQTRDQLLQDNLASLLTNFLFIISAGLYITLLIRYKNWTDLSFWWLAAACAGVLILIYLTKYLFLLFTGWVFNSKEAAGSYVFVVFLVNKVLGVLLVPFLLILAFARPELVQVSVTISIALVILLFIYRYWVSFSAIRNKLKVNALHFLLYLCAVEILPLVLIYKLLINYFNGSA